MTEDLAASAMSKNGDLSIPKQKKIKKHDSFNFFKAGLFIMRRSNNNKKKKQIQSSENEGLGSKEENWPKLAGSIHPLHKADNETPTISPSTTVDNIEDLLPQASSCSFPSPSAYESSSTGTMSNYASTSNLQQLDEHNADNENNNSNEVIDAIPEDEMIDAKAEKFIAQFYQHLNLERT